MKKNYLSPKIETVEISATDNLLTNLSIWVEKAQVETDETWDDGTGGGSGSTDETPKSSPLESANIKETLTW